MTKEERREYNKAYREKNKERLRVQAKEYYEARRDGILSTRSRGLDIVYQKLKHMQIGVRVMDPTLSDPNYRQQNELYEEILVRINRIIRLRGEMPIAR